MKAIGRGCLEFIIAWAIAAYAFYTYFHGKFEPPGDLYGAAAGGFLLASAWGLLRNVVLAFKQSKLIARSLSGARPQDGKVYAAVGKAKAVSSPIQTPFRKKDAVLYSYELLLEETVTYGRGSNRRDEKQKHVYLSGYAMAPWSVRTPIADIRVLGFPVPDQYPEERSTVSGFEQVIIDYNSSTKFEEIGKWEIGKIVGKVAGVFTEDDGVVREDWRFSNASPILEDLKDGSAPRDLEILEQCIAPGSDLTVIGKYSAQKNGLLQDLGTGGLQVIPGDPAACMNSLRKRAISYFIFSIILVALGVGAPFGILTAREQGHEIRQKHEARFLEALKSNDVALADQEIQYGVSPNMLDPQSRLAVLNVQSAEMLGLLKVNGIDLNQKDPGNGLTPLIWALDEGKLKLAMLLIDAGANLNAEQTGWKRTALETAFDRRQSELVSRLSRSHGVFVPDRLEYQGTSAQNSEFRSIMESYARALREQNVETVRTLVEDWPERFFNGVKSGLYSTSRAERWTINRSYVKDNVATVVASTEVDGFWLITFVKDQGRWRIKREHWDQEGAWAQ